MHETGPVFAFCPFDVPPILGREFASNTVQKTPKHSVRLRAHTRRTLSVNEAACRLMEVALPMLAEQLSRSAVEQSINNGYTGRAGGIRRLRRRLRFVGRLLKNSLIVAK